MLTYLNYPLVAAIAANLLAQLFKVFVHYLVHRTWKWSLLVSTGGLPSSHSATVTGLTVAVGLVEGMHSTLFAVSAVFSVIVMFDAAGVRRHAGQQAVVLNRLIREFQHLFTETPHKEQKLKELLGHKPLEVFAGAVFGAAVSLLLYWR